MFRDSNWIRKTGRNPSDEARRQRARHRLDHCRRHFFLMPADALPSFFPGYEHGLARIRMKHGLVSGGAGVVLLAIGWFMGRR